MYKMVQFVQKYLVVRRLVISNFRSLRFSDISGQRPSNINVPSKTRTRFNVL